MKNLAKILCLLLFTLGITTTTHAQEMPHPKFFIGNWGMVAFNDQSDLMKMAAVARGYCGQPYRIQKRSDETFSMYVEDKLKEVMLHAEKGQAYIVPVETENNVYVGARELHIIDRNTFTLEYIESSLNSRYGRNVFVRCR